MSGSQDKAAMLSEDQLYRIGDFAIGRSGVQPVVSFPESIAPGVAKFTRYTEIGGIVSFILSVIIFFVTRLAITVPFAIGAGVILFRAIVLFLNYTVIAKTTRTVEPSGEQPELEGSGSIEMYDGLGLIAGISGNTLGVTFQNASLCDMEIIAEVKAKSNIIQVQNKKWEFPLRTRHMDFEVVSPEESETKLEFDLEIAERVEYPLEDELIIEIHCNKIDSLGKTQGLGGYFESEITIPVSIQNQDEAVIEQIRYETVR